ncbi:MAG: hypothetical protein A2020_01425 [Lentisphaerae bacterium GWF2_45_14]|nr:MAG: hypothetical protein A2020_01425 [Lentisphaerae bacterium GWF2_45_14]
MKSHCLFLCYIILSMVPYTCGSIEVHAATEKAVPFKKNIAFLHSTHGAGGWGDDLEKALVNDFSVFPDVHLRLFEIDIDTTLSTESFKPSFPSVESGISAFSPDLIIALTDNAVEEFLNSSLKDKKIPTLVCMSQSNENHSYWGLNFAGVLFMDPMLRLYKNLRRYAKGNRLTVMSCRHAPIKTENLKVEFENVLIENVGVSSYSDFMEDYQKAQTKSDAVILAFSSLPTGWDPTAANDFLMKHTSIPTGTTYQHIAPYAMITMSPSVAETSSLITDSALKILHGAAPSMISPKTGGELVFIINISIAEKLGITISAPVLKTAKVIH